MGGVRGRAYAPHHLNPPTPPVTPRQRTGRNWGGGGGGGGGAPPCQAPPARRPCVTQPRPAPTPLSPPPVAGGLERRPTNGNKNQCTTAGRAAGHGPRLAPSAQCRARRLSPSPGTEGSGWTQWAGEARGCAGNQGGGGPGRGARPVRGAGPARAEVCLLSLSLPLSLSLSLSLSAPTLSFFPSSTPPSNETPPAIMGRRGQGKHMKRINAPKHLMLDKLGGIFVRF